MDEEVLVTVSQPRMLALEGDAGAELSIGSVNVEVSLGLRGPSGSGALTQGDGVVISGQSVSINIDGLPLAPMA